MGLVGVGPGDVGLVDGTSVGVVVGGGVAGGEVASFLPEPWPFFVPTAGPEPAATVSVTMSPTLARPRGLTAITVPAVLVETAA